MLEFESKITVGNILTVLSVALSVIALLYSWAKDRTLRQHEQAETIRTAASKTLAGLERWKSLSLWLFQDTQPTFVEASEKFVSDGKIEVVRDFLWKEVNQSWTEVQRRRLNERLELLYISLFSYRPELRDLVELTVELLRKQEAQLFQEFMSELEDIIFALEKDGSNLPTAEIGRRLRGVAKRYAICWEKHHDSYSEPIVDFLRLFVLLDDREILAGQAGSAEVGRRMDNALRKVGEMVSPVEWTCAEKSDAV